MIVKSYGHISQLSAGLDMRIDPEPTFQHISLRNVEITPDGHVTPEGDAKWWTRLELGIFVGEAHAPHVPAGSPLRGWVDPRAYSPRTYRQGV